MKLRSLGERDLITAIAREFPKKGRAVVLGIGDDASVLKPGKKLLILTKDLLVERVDFFRNLHPPYYLGRKSLNVNLSDVAAMGGRPRFALLGLGFPPETEIRWVREYLRGFKRAARETGVSLVGGDISKAAEIVISVTVLGEAGLPVSRGGGKPGDLLFVSGSLGDAQAGFRLLNRGFRLGRNRKAAPLLQAFLNPVPQLRLGRELSRRRLASAMIDLSDGLSVDLMHLCEASGVGAVIELEKVPLSSEIRAFVREPLLLALHGGEDFQLLFSAPPENRAALLKLSRVYSIAEIGHLTARKGIFVVNGEKRRTRLKPKGYEHFK